MKEPKTSRGFKGIWIPAEIWLNPDLSIQEKVFLVEIDSLDKGDGCYARNAYFQQFFGLGKRRVSEILSGLVEKGLIASDIDPDAGNARTLRPLWNNPATPIAQKLHTYSRKVLYPIEEKFHTPIYMYDNTIDKTIERESARKIPSDNYEAITQRIIELYDDARVSNTIKETNFKGEWSHEVKNFAAYYAGKWGAGIIKQQLSEPALVNTVRRWLLNASKFTKGGDGEATDAEREKYLRQREEKLKKQIAARGEGKVY